MQQKEAPSPIKTVSFNLSFLDNDACFASIDIPNSQQSQSLSCPLKLQKISSKWSVQDTPIITPCNDNYSPAIGLKLSSPPKLKLAPSVSCDHDYLDLNDMNGNNVEINTNTLPPIYNMSDDDDEHNNVAMNIESYLGLQKHTDNVTNKYHSVKSFKSISTTSVSEVSTEQQSYTQSELGVIADTVALKQYGYNIMNVITTTIHGCVYEAKMYEIKEENNKVNKARNSISLNGQKASIQWKQWKHSEIFERVAIKKVDKSIMDINKKIQMENSHNIDAENIIKEAIILNYLSVMNKPPCSDNIIKFIDFIETDSAYYLIEEYGGTQTLAQFIKNAHQYINEKKLKLKHWRITVKFIFWQISVLLYWMHTSMNVCHLDINANNILIGNGNFYENQKDGSITVDSKGLNVKLSDFGFGEIFPFNNDDDDEKKEDMVFQCVKRGITKDHHLKCPQQFNGLQRFDAKKSDCYSLGVLLYEMLTGSKPYQYPSPDKDDGYLALQTKELQTYLINNGLSKHVYRSTLSLVEGLLNIDEEERMDTKQILNHEWFEHYYLRYKARIQQKQQSQIIRHQRQHKKMQLLPYYTLQNDDNNKKIKQCVL